MWQSLQDGLSDKQMAEWIVEFFCGKKSASISDVYNKNAGSGSAKKEAVRKRLEEIRNNYIRYFKDVEA